jgi:hypothetical protein
VVERGEVTSRTRVTFFLQQREEPPAPASLDVRGGTVENSANEFVRLTGLNVARGGRTYLRCARTSVCSKTTNEGLVCST